MNTTLTENQARRYPREMYFLRRLTAIYLPCVALGMTGYFISYSHTLTANGLTLVSVLWVALWLLVAARDSRGV